MRGVVSTLGGVALVLGAQLLLMCTVGLALGALSFGSVLASVVLRA